MVSTTLMSPPLAATTVRAPWSGILAPLFCVGLILTVAFSRGFLEADEINHFLIARDSLAEGNSNIAWQLRADIWGRPGCTNLYAWATPLGITGPRLVSALMTFLTCLGTLRLARKVLPMPERPTAFDRHRTAWLWLLLLAQPFFLLNSATVMTEMLLAFCWVWAAVFVVEKRILLASLFIGLGGWARPEGFFGIAAWPVFLVLMNACSNQSNSVQNADAVASPDTPSPQNGPSADVLNYASPSRAPGFLPTPAPEAISRGKILLATFLGGLPVLLWFFAGVIIWQSWLWIQKDWPWKVKSQYGASTLRYFQALGIAAHTLWIPIGLAAIYCLVNRQLLRRYPVLLLLLPTLAFLLLHGVLGGFGLFGSMAMPRYFICIAPLLAILAYWGCALAAQRIPPVLVGALVLAMVAFPIVTVIMRGNLPIREPDDAVYMDAAAEALPSLVPRGEWAARVVAFHPYARYALNVPADVAYRSNDRTFMQHAPQGTVILSDSELWENEGGPKAADFLAWGYEIDQNIQAHIDAAIPDNDTRNPGHVQVHIWVKKK